jgi:DNA polymerase (family 10)
MKNAEIAAVFSDIAYLLRCKKDNIFKIRAYEKVARTITEMSVEVEQLVREDRLKEIPGVGEAINKKITELVNTGRLEYYERLKAEAAGVENGKT